MPRESRFIASPPEPPESDTDTECEDEPSENCEDDRCTGPQPPIFHCVDCDSSYCRYALTLTRFGRCAY